MAGGGPLPVREYADPAEMMRHAAEVRARLLPNGSFKSAALRSAQPANQVPVQAPAPQPRPEPKVKQDGFIPPKPARPQDFEDPKAFTMKRLTAICAEVTGVTALEITSHRRRPHQVKARHILCWIAKNYTGLSLPQIGHRVGRRDHSSVWFAVHKVQAIFQRLDAVKPDCPVAAVELLWAADWAEVSQ